MVQVFFSNLWTGLRVHEVLREVYDGHEKQYGKYLGRDTKELKRNEKAIKRAK